MSTWAEIRQEILTMLNIDTATTPMSDLYQLVDIKMKRKRDSLYNLRMPPALFVDSQDVVIDPVFQYIVLRGPGSGMNGTTPGFLASDCWKIYTLTVAPEIMERNFADWNFVSHPAWLRQQFTAKGGGDQREKNTWTIDYRERIYLHNIPATNEASWIAKLWYYKFPPDIADTSDPEIGREFEELLTLGVVIQFPNRFASEERLVLLQAYTAEYTTLLRDFLRQKRVMKSDARFRPIGRKYSSGYGGLNWGSGSTNPGN